MKKGIFQIYMILLAVMAAALSTVTSSAASILSNLKLPEGFSIEYFAEDIAGARSLTLGDDGVVYVGSRTEGKVYALVDKNKDGKADEKIVLLNNLNMPNGVAYFQGDLYVAEIHRITKLEKINQSNLKQEWKQTMVYSELPKRKHHGWRYIAFGPDKYLYIGIGAPCNVCLSDEEIFATISRLDLEQKKLTVFAKGIRNTVGFDWHPSTQELWFTDNGRDWMGDEVPPDEVNRAATAGLHFGFPYLHGSDIQDPKFWDKRPVQLSFTLPVHNATAHSANLGIRFYKGEHFPHEMRGAAFIAEHGSWNRSQKVGYKITKLKLKSNHIEVEASEDFITGWVQPDGKVLGRPVDLMELPDGSLLISDDFHHAIYRVIYKQKKKLSNLMF